MEDVEDAHARSVFDSRAFKQIEMHAERGDLVRCMAARRGGEPVKNDPQVAPGSCITDQAFDHGRNGGWKRHRERALPERMKA